MDLRKKAHGEANGRSKLTANIVREARKRYKKGKSFRANLVSCLNLALEYDVSASTMYYALNRKTWKHLKD